MDLLQVKSREPAPTHYPVSRPHPHPGPRPHIHTPLPPGSLTHALPLRSLQEQRVDDRPCCTNFQIRKFQVPREWLPSHQTGYREGMLWNSVSCLILGTPLTAQSPPPPSPPIPAVTGLLFGLVGATGSGRSL